MDATPDIPETPSSLYTDLGGRLREREKLLLRYLICLDCETKTLTAGKVEGKPIGTCTTCDAVFLIYEEDGQISAGEMEIPDHEIADSAQWWKEKHDALQQTVGELLLTIGTLRDQNMWASKFECPKCGPIGYEWITTMKTCLNCRSGLIRGIHPLEARIEELREALFQHRADLHGYSRRPCATCRNSAKVLGISDLVPDSCSPAWDGVNEREMKPQE